MGLGDVEALVEYQLPLTSKRADVVLAGAHPRHGTPSYVVVELKQWTRANLLDGTDDVCQLDGYGERLHRDRGCIFPGCDRHPPGPKPTT